MLGNVKRSPKKGRGVKEALAVMDIVGSMGSSIKEMKATGNRKK